MNATNAKSASAGRGRLWPWTSLAVAAALMFAYLIVVGGLRRASPGGVGPAVGQSLPFIEFQPLTGMAQPISTESLRGKVTLINFWGTWCPPCRREFPDIVKLHDTLSGNPHFRLYAVSCGSGADEDVDELRSETQKFLEANRFSIPTHHDPGAASRRALAMVLAPEEFAYPTTIVVDPKGVIRGSWIGYDPAAQREMHALIEDLLHEAVATPAA